MRLQLQQDTCSPRSWRSFGPQEAWSNAERWERGASSTPAPSLTDQGNDQALPVKEWGMSWKEKRWAAPCPDTRGGGVGAEVELQNVDSKFMASEVTRFLISKRLWSSPKKKPELYHCFCIWTSPRSGWYDCVSSACTSPPLAKKAAHVCVWIYTPILLGNQTSDLTRTLLTSEQAPRISCPLLDG